MGQLMAGQRRERRRFTKGRTFNTFFSNAKKKVGKEKLNARRKIVYFGWVEKNWLLN
jgi:hypothetical protein